MSESMKSVPNMIAIDRYERMFPPPIEPGDQVWRRTSHAWANAHLDDTCWLDAMCDGCVYEIWEFVTHAIGSNPHEDCEKCGRKPIPYRRAVAEERE